jgi:hypothetical protein
LVAPTLSIAENRPAEKDTLAAVIVNLISPAGRYRLWAGLFCAHVRRARPPA